MVVPVPGRVGERPVLVGHEHGRRRGIGIGEGDHLLAVVGDRERVHDHVVLAGLQRRDRAVEVRGDDLAFDLHAAAEILQHLRLEAADGAVRIGQVPGLVGALRHHRDALPVLGFDRWTAPART